tara:strand:+ start:242 stop:1390 length:1149 start_codon:yes stop_codon:yes gene_type:complete
MQYELTEDQKLIRDTAREFAEKHVREGVLERDEKCTFPHRLVEQLAELGFMGMVYPEQYGGSEVDYVSFSCVIEELARWDASLAITVASHTSLCTGHIYEFGSDELKNKYLPDLVSGKVLGGWGLTEPGAGSDASGTKTTAVLDGDEWVLNGAKTFITQGTVGGTFVVMASTDKSLGSKGISAFVVERGTPGFSHGAKMDKLGHRSSDTAELIFENVRIPKGNLIGNLNEGFIQSMKVLEGGRIGIAALSTGIARGALEDSIIHVKERVQFGKPLAALQSIQFKIADMAAEIEAARLLTHRAAFTRDQGLPYNHYSSMAKLYASEICMQAAHQCVQMLGGSGYMEEYHAQRYFRDAKLMEIGEGTSEIQRLVISREVFRQFS